jgi:hypothetical protein
VTWQVEDFLLEYLRDAAEELRKRSRGKIGEIRALGIAVESPAWPEEVRLARVELKRRRGRQPGWRSDAQERFFADPNRVAAAIAACLIADFYEEWAGRNPKRHPPHKVTVDGVKKSLHVSAAGHAVELVNAQYVHLLPRPRKATLGTVEELLRRGRTAWPDGERI